jgi:hypothetical protein
MTIILKQLAKYGCPALRNSLDNIKRIVNRLIGGAEGIRTPDLLNANQALSQLSYSPWDMVGGKGLEPMTFCV